jgi:hypothetical protein
VNFRGNVVAFVGRLGGFDGLVCTGSPCHVARAAWTWRDLEEGEEGILLFAGSFDQGSSVKQANRLAGSQSINSVFFIGFGLEVSKTDWKKKQAFRKSRRIKLERVSSHLDALVSKYPSPLLRRRNFTTLTTILLPQQPFPGDAPFCITNTSALFVSTVDMVSRVTKSTRRVLCDCTFRDTDHWLSDRQRRKHRQHYERRQVVFTPSPPPPAGSTIYPIPHHEHQDDDIGEVMEDIYGDNSGWVPGMLDALPDISADEDKEFGDGTDEDGHRSAGETEEEDEGENENEEDEQDPLDVELDEGDNIQLETQDELERLEALSGIIYSPSQLITVFEIPGEWEETLRYFHWKCHSNVSDLAYGKLCKQLALSNVVIHSLHATRRYLRSTLGIFTKDYHRCVKGCMVFNGQEKHRRCCVHCQTSRFVSDDDLEPSVTGGSEFFADAAEYSQFVPKAVYTYTPIIPRLKLLYTNPVSAAKMRYPKTLRDDPWEDGIRDVWEGEAMKRWIEAGIFKGL